MAAASLVVGLKSLAVMLAGCRKGLFHAALTWFRVKRVPVVVTV